MNNLNKKSPKLSLIIACLIFFSISLYAQVSEPKRQDYTISDSSIEGETVYSAETIITYSGLKKGEIVTIPGGVKISNAIKKLWDSNLFNNIDVYILKIEDNNIFLQIRLDDLPELKEVKVTGVKKGKISGIIDENKLTQGVKVTENLITTTKNYLESKYKKEGFLKIISIFSFLGIMLGVAILIIVMSVMNGFKTELTNKILGLNPHIVIQPNGFNIDEKYISEIENNFKDISVSKTFSGEGVIIINDQAKGIIFKGVNREEKKIKECLEKKAVS